MKKVRKFLDCAVDVKVDRKQLKADMDRAFQKIKDCYANKDGHDRSVVILAKFYFCCLHDVGDKVH